MCSVKFIMYRFEVTYRQHSYEYLFDLSREHGPAAVLTADVG